MAVWSAKGERGGERMTAWSPKRERSAVEKDVAVWSAKGEKVEKGSGRLVSQREEWRKEVAVWSGKGERNGERKWPFGQGKVRGVEKGSGRLVRER